MKRTGPTNSNTRQMLVHVHKHAKASKQNVYNTLFEIMSMSSRGRAEVNLHHLNEMGEKHKDKILVVPGIVLAKGDITMPLEIAAFRFSGSAKQKITQAKGKAWTLGQLVENKVPGSKIILVK